MQPIFLTPFYDEKPWGGRRLESLFGRKLPFENVGESFEVSALRQGESVVRGGVYHGMALSELYEHHPRLFGGRGGSFPFFIKFADVGDTQSVQVHPNDRIALEYEGVPVGKTEAWAIIAADEGAKLSVRADIPSGAALLDALYGDYIEDTLIWEDAKPGDVFFIPAGTLHTVGGGVVLYELQQPANITYRVFDWGRGRMTHPEKSAAAYDPLSRAGKVSGKKLSSAETRLVSCNYFTLDSVDASCGFKGSATDDFCVYTALSEGAVSCEGGNFTFRAGESFIIPAGLGGYDLNGGLFYRAAAPKNYAV